MFLGSHRPVLLLSSLASLPILASAFLACGGGTGGAGGTGGNGDSPASLCLDVKPVSVVPPAGLQLRFRALDCDGNPVRRLTAADVGVLNDEKGVAFGKGGEGDSVSGVGENSNVELYSVLVLDLSNSIFQAGSIDAVTDGAKSFVDETVTKPQAALKHRVAVIAFGRPDQITLEHDFSQDDASLLAKLEELRSSPPRGTTDLYDAYMLALDTVAATGSGGDAVVERFVVLLTDGTHEAGNEETLRKQALARKHATRATVYTIGIEGNYDACRLEELAGRGGVSTESGCREESACTAAAMTPAACTQFLPSVSRKTIGDAFQQIAARAAGIARSNYVVGICTPVSLGEPTLTLKVDVDGTKAQETLPYSVSGLNGDVNSCEAASIQQGKLACDGAGQCEVVCLQMTCGTDHGVSCGSCGAKQVCSAAQKCEDVCVGMTCGSDHGVSCGTCTGSDYCEGNVCKTPCAGMTCGSDHGVSCGTCSGSDYCEGNVCTAPCTGMTCGSDHGVSCGTCSGSDYCEGNVCTAPCTGMTCGSDHGVSCGTCSGSDYCESNVCTAPCTGKQCGTDHGVDCGTCANGSGCDGLGHCIVCGPGISFAAKVDYATGSVPASVAAADLNSDGKPDIVVANVDSNTVSVLLNQGNGTLAAKVDYGTGSTPYSVAAADLNSDGKPDLVTANWVDHVSVLLNQGNGTFAAKVDHATGSAPNSVAVTDLNGDGKPDLVTANHNSNTVSVLLNQGNGTFAAKVDYATGSGPYSVAAADLNGDGKPDLVTANGGSNTVSVLLNQGNGTFAAKVDYATAANPTSVAAADLNGDGKPDLVTGNYNSNTVSVLLNQGNGTFAAKVDYATGSLPYSVAAADLNGDGKPDLVIGNYNSNTVSVLLNQGNGTFAAKVDYAAGANPTSVAAADLNGDGKPDLVVTNGDSNSVSVLLGECLP